MGVNDFSIKICKSFVCLALSKITLRNSSVFLKKKQAVICLKNYLLTLGDCVYPLHSILYNIKDLETESWKIESFCGYSLGTTMGSIK